MLIPHGTVVAVVDGEKLELYRNSGNEAAPDLVSMESPVLDGHNKDSGARHHSSSANPTGHLLDEDAHAAAAAEWLNQQVLAHKIEHVIVVAPPRTLGELRRHYNKAVEAALVGELHKELIHKSAQDILAALQK